MTPMKILALIAMLAAIFSGIFALSGILSGWVIPLICLAIILIAIALLM